MRHPLPGRTKGPLLLLALSAGLMVGVWAAPARVLAQGQAPGRTAATGTPRAFSLEQAVAYAMENSIIVRNARTDQAISQARIGEIRSIGLPQINAGANLTYNIKVQQFVQEITLDNPFFAQQAALNLDQPRLIGAPVGFALALPYAAAGQIQAEQLLFNGSYILGLKAASVYTNLTSKQAKAARIETRAAVTKAYYQAMVGQQQIRLLDGNLDRLDTTIRQLQAQYRSGFVEQIDVQRLEVQRNNLSEDRQAALRGVELALAALKFQMNYPMREPITLTDNLESTRLEQQLIQEPPADSYDQRIEYQILGVQEQLATLDLRNRLSGYLPTLSFGATVGANTAATSARNLFDFGYREEFFLRTDPDGVAPRTRLLAQRWIPFSFVGLNLGIPVFDGLRKRYEVQTARLNLQKVRDSRQLVQQQIDLSQEAALIAQRNAASRLANQQRNLELAREIVRVTRVKYRSGVGSSLEVANAETDLRLAQDNYYAALYDALVARVDADIAAGRLSGD